MKEKQKNRKTEKRFIHTLFLFIAHFRLIRFHFFKIRGLGVVLLPILRFRKWVQKIQNKMKNIDVGHETELRIFINFEAKKEFQWLSLSALFVFANNNFFYLQYLTLRFREFCFFLNLSCGTGSLRKEKSVDCFLTSWNFLQKKNPRVPTNFNSWWV